MRQQQAMRFAVVGQSPDCVGRSMQGVKNGRRLRRIQNGAVEDQERSVRGDFSQIVEALGIDIATEGYTLSGMVNPVDHGRLRRGGGREWPG